MHARDKKANPKLIVIWVSVTKSVLQLYHRVVIIASAERFHVAAQFKERQKTRRVSYKGPHACIQTVYTMQNFLLRSGDPIYLPSDVSKRTAKRRDPNSPSIL